jgi:integrase
MSPHIRYAYLRHNTWTYRRTYPKALQGVLGSSLKQSLKTQDARVARSRVEEMNRTYLRIISEAEALAGQGTGHTSTFSDEPTTLEVSRPHYPRLRLQGDQTVEELGGQYLQEASQRLRPGSFKSVRYAIELLVSHLGKERLGQLSVAQGREVLELISRLSPNVRKYTVAEGQDLKGLAALSGEVEAVTLSPQTQARIWEQMCGFLDWSQNRGEVASNPWSKLRVAEGSEVSPHSVLTDAQVVTLLTAKDRVLDGALLFGLLTGLRSGEIAGLEAADIVLKGNLGRFLLVRPNSHRLLKSKTAERVVPLHPVLENYLDTHLPRTGRLFPTLSVDRVVKAYAKLRSRHIALSGTVFHSTRKWFITQCERTGVPEHFTASLVGHQSARSANRLTYGLYSGGISDAQKRDIIDRIRLPAGAQT